MESIESIVSNFSKNLFTCRNPIKTGKHNPQNARPLKHAAHHVQELCNSLSDTLGRRDLQTQHRTMLSSAVSSSKLIFFPRSDGN